MRRIDIEETKLRMNTLAKNGGLIIGPSHGVQPNTPLENIFAFYETVTGEDFCEYIRKINGVAKYSE